MSKFTVDLTELKMSPEIARQFENSIHAATLDTLARLDLQGDITVRIPRKEWLGIWIKGHVMGPKAMRR